MQFDVDYFDHYWAQDITATVEADSIVDAVAKVEGYFSPADTITILAVRKVRRHWPRYTIGQVDPA